MEKGLGTRPRLALPVFVLICGLSATTLATYLINENLRFKTRERLKEAASNVERTIQSRMESYIGLLRGGAGLFAASEYVTLERFRQFVERLEITKRFPGLQGYGYSARVPQPKVGEVVASMRAQGVTNFSVWPIEPPRPEYHTIVYLEPMDERNRRTLGYDMFTERHRRDAMEAARDFGNPRFSKKIKLIKEDQEEPGHPGVVLYLPIYTDGQVPETKEARQERLQGFIYSPFRAEELFGGIYPKMWRGLAFAIWDGAEPKAHALLYQSDPAFSLEAPHDLLVLQIPGAVWMLGVCELPGPRPADGRQLLWVVPLLGVLASCFLSYSTLAEGRSRARTEQTANELFEQREWLQVTIGSIGDAVISTDRFGRVRFMNGVAESLIGWKLEETQGKPLRDVFHIQNEKSGEEIDNPADRVLTTGATIHLSNNTLLVDRNGTERSIDDSAAPIRDRQGNLVGAVLVFRDITERRRYERRSTAQHAVTRVLAESPSLPEAAVRILAALCETLRFDFGLLWTYEEEPKEIRLLNIWHTPGAHFDRFEEVCRNVRFKRGEGLPGLVLETQEPQWVSEFSRDTRFPRAEEAGKAGLRTAFAFPIAIGPETFGILEFFARESNPADTELLNVARGIGAQIGQFVRRKRAEASIQELNQELEVRVERRTAALQESKEQMEAFSYTIAHDLRAPLRAMQGFAHALVEDYTERLDPAGIDYLTRIMASAHRMDSLIQDLLAYSKLSRSDLTFNPVSVEQAIQNALRAHEEYIHEMKAEVEVATEDLFVRAHAATLENAVGNLLSNAIKFARAGAAPKVVIQTIDRGDTVRIAVQDTGIGIAPEHHERIFRVFERLHGQNSFPGTGIGLALVKKGVERMGGQVGVTSEPGQGSLFWIELPKDSAPG
jgi:PAS domain S-box-containing protein